MNDGLKQRLVGALVLTALGVIFLPSLFKQEERTVVDTTSLIPLSPKVQPVVIPKPVKPKDITPAPAPEQAFQPTEEPQLDEELQPNEEPQSDKELKPGEEPRSTEKSSPATAPKVEASPSLDARGIPKAWTVQIASFVEPQRAKILRDKLLTANYNVYLRVLKTDKGEVTRVFIGPQIDRRSAQAIKNKIDKELSVNSLIMSFAP